jgi:cobalt-zinc-cadmium efflux system outer membrane protein
MIEEAKKTYYEWLVLEKQLKVLEESERLITLMIKSGEISYTYNQSMLGRVYKAKSELYNLQNSQIVTQNEIKQKNIELNTLMNINKGEVYTIDTAFMILNYEKVAIDTSTIIKNRSDIRNIDESIKLYSLKRNMELSKRKPDFGIQYWHMNMFGNQPNQFTLMGMVTIPIVPWVAKGYNANIQGIKFEMASLNRKKEAVLNKAIGKLEKTRSQIASKKKQVDMYEKNIIPALQKNYNASLIAFEHMKEDLFMTIDAWQTLKMAKIEYLNLLGELLNMQVEYERQIEN